MKIKWNEVTRFSQIVAIVLFVAIFFAGFCIGRKYERVGGFDKNIFGGISK